jgi:hypothetical protein
MKSSVMWLPQRGHWGLLLSSMMYIRQRVQAPVTRAQRLVVADLDSAAGFVLSSASEAEVLKQKQNTHTKTITNLKTQLLLLLLREN